MDDCLNILLTCFRKRISVSGAIVGALVLGEPLLEFFSNAPLVLSMTAAWYLVFYAPFDAFVRAVSALRLRLPLVAMQGIEATLARVLA